MRNRIIFLGVLLGFVILANAQNKEISKHSIEWKGIKTWYSESKSKKILSFKDAEYIDNENFLPYFTQKTEINPKFEYSVSVENTTLHPLSKSEVELFSTSIPEKDIKINTFLSYSKGKTFYNIELLPFLKKNKQYYRLSNFELKITKKERNQTKTTTNHTYSSNSVLANGKFIKIAVKKSGIYKITYQELKDMGIVPENVRIFGYGGALLEQDFTKSKIDDLPEVSVWMEKGDDGVFNSGDYILFYGQGLVKWQYNKSRGIFTHTLNHYANEGYYFVTSDVGLGKRIENKVINIPKDAKIFNESEFTDYRCHEIEKINLGETGKVFLGEEFSGTSSYNFSFNFPNIVPQSNIKTRLEVVAIANKNSFFYLDLNGGQRNNILIPSKPVGDHYTIGKLGNAIHNYKAPSKEDLVFTLTYNKPNEVAKGYLNYLEVNAKRKLAMTGSLLFFRNVDNIYTNSYTKYTLSNANKDIQIWDITNPEAIKRVPSILTGTTLEFTDSNNSLKQYLAINPKSVNNSTLKPVVIGKVSNQNLHNLPNADFVIITHPDFLDEAERLAQVHREIDNMSVNVVTTQQVYNEFSSGTPDASAYRWFLKMFYDRALELGQVESAPKYLLLFGRGSYDNRGIINSSGDNLIITYQADKSLNEINSYVCDDYFGLLDNKEGIRIRSDMVDVGIGRFPVKTKKEATDVVNKTISYIKNELPGIWKNQLVFVADDGDASLHIKQCDRIAQLVYKQNPTYQLQKIYLDAYQQEMSASGESYPLARERLHSMINSGCLLVNFMGHASPLGWTNERIFLKEDVYNMYNKKLPFFMTATCNFVKFDVKDVSAGEYLLLNPSGGGIGLYSAARTVYASHNENLNRYFTQKLFDNSDGTYPRLGDAVKYSKNKVGTEINKLSYLLFGDPAIRLNYPKDYNVIVKKINDTPVSGEEVFNALSVQKIEGEIEDKNQNIVSDFNGELEAVIFDKEQKITTLNNDKNGGCTYADRPNILYSGKVDVKDGKFTLIFMVPRDIRYNMGTGRINYYASDTINKKEAQGYYENFKVGGSNSNYEHETDGPNVVMYLNTPNFQSQDKVNETPLFVAKISDINGINTSGNGIGHDLRLIIDDNSNTSYTLNPYFQSEPNSFKSGVVKFKIPKLSEGKHTLTFHAWDLLNNSTTVSFDFEVVEGLEPTIFNVSNYPNPVKDYTKFIVIHDRPEIVLTSILNIYDLSGRPVFSKSYSNLEDISWDLKDNNGKKVQSGAYIYNMSIKTMNSKFVSKSNKIIVIGQ